MPENATARAITPNAYAKRLGVSIHKILAWIARGELRAVNVANTASGRPQWAIPPEAIADFEHARAAQPQQATTRRTVRNGDYKRFF